MLDEIITKLYQSRQSLQAMFMLFDTNQDGKISRDEFKIGLRMLGLVSDKYGDELRDWQIDELVTALDADDDGEISFTEFNQAFRIVDTSNGVAMKPSVIKQ